MKNLRKPYLSIFLASLVLFVSCSQYDNSDNLAISNQFDYSLYEGGKKQFVNVKPININNYNSKTSAYQMILDYVNSPFDGSAILKNPIFKLTNLSADELQKTGLQKGFFTKTDIDLIEQFNNDLQIENFDFALNNYKKNVIELNLSNIDFNKYNQLVNVLMLTKSNYNKNADVQSRAGWACGIAIFSFTAATVFVGSTCVPNPVTIYACPIAIARAAIAYTSMLLACGGQE